MEKFLKLFFLGLVVLSLGPRGAAKAAAEDSAPQAVKTILPAVLDSRQLGENLLSDRFFPYGEGYIEQNDQFWCDNGDDSSVTRGVVQVVELNQTKPLPLYASGESLAENVAGGTDSSYSLYLDLTYTDGTHQWGESVPFSCGSHDWQKKGLYVFPAKPIQSLSFHGLFRSHSGKAAFRNLALQELRGNEDTCLFDTLPLDSVVPLPEGILTFQLRGAEDDSPFYRVGDQTTADGRVVCACGVDCAFYREERPEGDFYRAELTNKTGEDRCLTFLVSYPIRREKLFWLENGLADQESVEIEPGREYFSGSTWPVGVSGRLSRWPFAAVASDSGDGAREGIMLGIDPDYPAFYRLFYSEPAGELVLAYDLALTSQSPTAELKFFSAPFAARDRFAGALSAYCRFFPNHFLCRTPSQGNWMPFAKISAVPGWEDFGFKFKEGNDQTAWDDEHGIITFRYTEPMTWWMPLAKEEPHTIEFGVEKAKQLAEAGNIVAQAFLTSGHKNEEGRFCGRVLDTPWCDGIVWSVNDLPGLEKMAQEGKLPYSDRYPVSGFGIKWNRKVADAQYGPPRDAAQDGGYLPSEGLDGEYIDSSEGYVTDICDYDQSHFAAAARPLVFDRQGKPAIFRGLIAYEYTRAMAEDVHRRGHLMMANSTPTHLSWLVPFLDVAGTETNWNRDGKWSPMPMDEMYYRRALMGKKPFCFLMNSDFTLFSYEATEKYMNRALAFGMFPGFFSADASTKHYFENPDLYERDRPLFKKFMPVIQEVAQAGWEPLALARAEDDRLNVLRFGDGLTVYLTVFNDSEEPLSSRILLDDRLLEKWGNAPIAATDRFTGEEIPLDNAGLSVCLDQGKTAVIKIAERR